MAETGDATPYVPDGTSLATLRDGAAHCRGCHLHEHATQTVFGEGPRNARVMLVGEQPGDREDREGHPFVGPAGRELGEALAAPIVTATAHPSAILRMRGHEARVAARDALRADLALVAEALRDPTSVLH
jgi:uracil-DNA glycosylase